MKRSGNVEGHDGGRVRRERRTLRQTRNADVCRAQVASWTPAASPIWFASFELLHIQSHVCTSHIVVVSIALSASLYLLFFCLCLTYIFRSRFFFPSMLTEVMGWGCLSQDCGESLDSSYFDGHQIDDGEGNGSYGRADWERI